MSVNDGTVTTSTERVPGRALNVVLWVLQVLLGVFIAIASGVPKIFGVAGTAEGFETIGAAAWFRVLVGLIEVAGGIGLVIPRLSGLAAIGLSLLMIGAFYTNAFIADGLWPWSTPLILLVFFAFIAWGRRYQTKRFFSRSLGR